MNNQNNFNRGPSPINGCGAGRPVQPQFQPQYNNPAQAYGYNGGYGAYPDAARFYPQAREKTPEEKRASQIRYEKKLVRKLGNRTGWASFIVYVIMNLLAIAISLSFLTVNTNEFLELENSVVSLIGMFVGGTFLILATNTKMRDAITFKTEKSSKRCFAALLIGFAAIPLCNLFSQIVSDNLSLIGIQQKSYGITSVGDTNITFFYIAVEVLCTAIVPAIGEEYMFRGAILGALKPYGEGFAIIMSSLLFGLLHGNFEQIPFAFLGGIFFGYIRVYTGSLLYPMILHFSNNLLSVIMDILNTVCPDPILGTKIALTDIIAIVYYTIFITFAIIAFVKLSRRDENFLRLKRPQSLISEKQKAVSFIVSPGFIAFTVIMMLITAYQYIVA